METTTLTIRLTPELKQSLEILAKKDARSMNNLINLILRDYVNNMLPDKDKK